ncbi:BNR repeat-containing protein [Cellulophaga baltica]|uniref:BNR-4 repeat-containing protein n=1 Tax=Cellulophaga TaxID=104264 RepID=UPI001C0745D9|nr:MULTISPECIES: BNR-4 repeat-containing protein [Cellulophaga]MBU2995975.1 BNR repeat-containing protein [Cellulophaga baltica]MDO6767370.1 BNR-4 repeat-containing protein [Cellulophaga sp. 1_MG-2023]
MLLKNNTIKNTSTLILLIAFNLIFCQKKNNKISITSISKQGSSRATAYIDSNKIIETKDKIFVTYLIHNTNKEYIALKEYDKNTKKWSTEIVLDSVSDNHGGGSIVIDSKGYLHIAYGPHVGPFNYRKSKYPNNCKIWEEKILIGSNMTYPSLAINKNDDLYLLGRNTVSRGAWSLMLFSKNVNELKWTKGKILLKSNFEKLPSFGKLKDNPKNLTVKNGYTRWNKSIIIGDDDIIHISFKNYEFHPRNKKYKFTDNRNGGSYFVGYMYSKDNGKSWLNNGKKLSLPSYSADIELVSGNSNPEFSMANYGISNIAFNNGKPYFVYSKELNRSSKLFLTFKKKGKWFHKEIKLDKNSTDYLYSPSAISFFKKKLYIVATAMPKDLYLKNELWGKKQQHTSLKILKLDSSYDLLETYSTKDLNIKSPSWLPNISRYDNNGPKLLFTQGLSNSKNTEVYFMKIKK